MRIYRIATIRFFKHGSFKWDTKVAIFRQKRTITAINLYANSYFMISALFVFFLYRGELILMKKHIKN